MGHLENKMEWCLNKAKKEGEKHRGLKEIKPDIDKAKKHIAKADHNLKAMLYLIKGNFTDWAVSASFYSRYHCLLAILAKHGYESRNQECTFAAVEFLIKNKKIELDAEQLKKISSFEDNMDEENIVKLREDFQYGTDVEIEDTKMKELKEDTKKFIEIAKAALE